MAKLTAVLDPDNHRYIIAPLKPGNKMDVKTIFRTIKDSTLLTFAEMAEFSGLRNANAAFRVAYKTTHHDLITQLNEFMVIDVGENRAYLYDKDHKPASTPIPYTGPTLQNKEDADHAVTETVPAKITTRITVVDPLDRNLKLTLEPTGGYLLGLTGLNLSEPGMKYETHGHPSTLNKLLRKLHFVGTAAGAGSIKLTLTDPGSSEPTASVNTTVNCTISAIEVPSIPSIKLPLSQQTVVLGEQTEIDAIEVVDDDGKLLNVRIVPFGCTIAGFKNYLGYIEPGQTRELAAVPEYINADLANLVVTATEPKAQIFIGLSCGKTHLQEYLNLNVQTNDEADEDEEEDVVKTSSAPTGHQETQAAVQKSPVAAQSAPVATPAPAEPTPVAGSVTSSPKNYKGVSGATVASGITVGGDAKTEYVISLAPNNCAIKVDGKDSTEAVTRKGTVAAINGWLKTISVVIGQNNGSIKVTMDKTNVTIPVAVQAAPKTEPAATTTATTA